VIIELKLFGGLGNHLCDLDGPQRVEVEDGATIAAVLERFEVPLDAPRVMLVNGRHKSLDHVLEDGDVVAVFPPVAGG
jgi:molybdopterin converting factor small subunit